MVKSEVRLYGLVISDILDRLNWITNHTNSFVLATNIFNLRTDP